MRFAQRKIGEHGCTELHSLSRWILGLGLPSGQASGKPRRRRSPSSKPQGVKQGALVHTLIVNQAIRPLKEAFEKPIRVSICTYVPRRRKPDRRQDRREAQAGRVRLTCSTPFSSMVPLRRAGLVAPFVPSAAGQYPADLKDADGYGLRSCSMFCARHQTPRWCPRHRRPNLPGPARPALERNDGVEPWLDGRRRSALSANTLIGMGEERGRAYLEALSRQQIVNIEASSRAILDQVIAGEYPWPHDVQ